MLPPMKPKEKEYPSIPNYHEKAQAFIKSAHSQGRNVTAEGEELITDKVGTYKSFSDNGHLDAHIMEHKKREMSQRDTYNKAMMSAQKKGGSNGVGVGK